MIHAQHYDMDKFKNETKQIGDYLAKTKGKAAPGKIGGITKARGREEGEASTM